MRCLAHGGCTQDPGLLHRDSAVKQFLGAASSFESFWDVTVQFGNDFVNGFFPGGVGILACSDGTEELLQCQAGHLQEPPWHLQQDRHQPVTEPWFLLTPANTTTLFPQIPLLTSKSFPLL